MDLRPVHNLLIVKQKRFSLQGRPALQLCMIPLCLGTHTSPIINLLNAFNSDAKHLIS